MRFWPLRTTLRVRKRRSSLQQILVQSNLFHCGDVNIFPSKTGYSRQILDPLSDVCKQLALLSQSQSP